MFDVGLISHEVNAIILEAINYSQFRSMSIVWVKNLKKINIFQKLWSPIKISEAG